jgi:carbon storage regulator
MLVLDRKINEGFWIEGNIFVKVLGVGRRRVKLGIDAPGDMKIVREELSSHPAGEAREGRIPSVPDV